MAKPARRIGGSVMAQYRPARPPGDAATTTDLLKFAALVLVVVDHYGLLFDEDENWWRVPGRLAAPVFFFLIGFARTRGTPTSWLLWGAVLTAADYATSGSIAEVSPNILLNFALLRSLVLPAVERWVVPQPWRLAVLAFLLAALIDPSDRVLEYGTEGWLWALFGLLHRTAPAEPSRAAPLTRTGVAAVAGTAYVLREIHDHAFNLVQATLLAAMVVGLSLLLGRFRRVELAPQPPEPLAALLRFCGTRSLEIYAVTLLVMQISAYAVENFFDNGTGA